MLSALGVSAVFAAWIVASSPVHENAELKRAEAAVSNLRYDDALTALSRARAVRGNDRPTLLRILEMQGVVAGQLRKSKIAEAAFRELLVLDPDHHLSKDYNPRVMTPFYEAKRIVAEKGSLAIRPLDAELSSGQLHSIGLQIDSDPLAMSRAVRFHWRPGNGDWLEAIGIPLSGKARNPVTGSDVFWWAELLGDQDAVLSLLGSAEAPRIEHGAPVAPAATPSKSADAFVAPPPPPPPPATVSPEAVAVATPALPGSSGARIGSYVLVGGALVAGGVGGYFGYQSQQDYSTVQKTLAGNQNPVTSATERKTTDINNQSKQYAIVANVLFGAAGVLAAGGIALWFMGGSVTVAPSPTGASVSGSF
jgi:hypothetical protein